jgi:DNA-binding MltR family transcriptional regulator
MFIHWHGEGADRIGSEAFSQLENDSDRAVGIVAGAIVEQRLTEAIKARFVQNDTIIKRMFDISNGPIGTFGAKIDLAFLMGIISTEARTDLRAMKDIRNSFAHKLEIDSFEHQEIKGRSLGMRLIERYFQEYTAQELQEMTTWMASLTETRGTFDRETMPSVMKNEATKLVGADAMLKDPRKRYVICSQYFSFRLGAGSSPQGAHSISTVAVMPAERTTLGGTSSIWMRTGMRWARRTQVKMGLTVATP